MTRRLLILTLALAGLTDTDAQMDAPQPGRPPSAAWKAEVRQAAPEAPLAPPKQDRSVLVFSLSTGFDHAVTPYAEAMLEILGASSGAYRARPGKDIEEFLPERIQRYDAIVLNNNCPTRKERNVFRDVLINEVDRFGRKYGDLPLAEREAMAATLYTSLAEYVAGGGGLVLIHGAIANFNYADDFSAIAGGSFHWHPPSQQLTLFPVEPGHPLLAPFKGKPWILNDEPYFFNRAYDRMDFRPLLEIDAAEISDGQHRKQGLEKKRYAAWIKRHEQGRVFFCSPSHHHQTYKDPALLEFILGGVQYAIGDLDCPDTPPQQELRGERTGRND